MFTTKQVITQTARMELWVNIIVALLISFFALIFIPLSYENPIAWFVGLSIISYIFVYFTMGLRSRITLHKELTYTLSIPEHSSNRCRKIPFEYITHVEVCEYKLFKRDCYYPDEVNNDYYYKKTMFGYQGAGLIVCYQLPKTMSGDFIVRGIRFPAPKANECLSVIKENMRGV